MSWKAFAIVNLVGASVVAAAAEYRHGAISGFFNPCSSGNNSDVTLESSYGELLRGAHCGERRGLGFGNGLFDASEDLTDKAERFTFD